MINKNAIAELTFMTSDSTKLISTTALISAGMDLLAVAMSGLISIHLMVSGLTSQRSAFDHRGYFASILWYAGWMFFFSQTHHLYGNLETVSRAEEFRWTLQSSLVASLVLCGTLYLLRWESVSRRMLLLTVALTTGLVLVRRTIWRAMVYARCKKGISTRNVLIVGSGAIARSLRDYFERSRHLGFRFKGFIALVEEHSLTMDPDIIGTFHNCASLARALFVDEIFLCAPANKEQVLKLVQDARNYDIELRVVPDIYGGLTLNAPLEYIGQFPTIPLHRRNFPLGQYVIKRMIDTLVSGSLLLLLWPLFLIISLLIAAESNGPIFYRAKRIGRKGRTFNCYKFRSMVPNADSLKSQLEHQNERDGILFKISNDPRITTVGRFLRKYSLDELPQLWNVIAGDMSLVGPRPPLSSEVEKYDLSHLKRLDVLPGITGLWQVEARQDPSFENYISLDTAYVENWSLWLDFKILAKTFAVVFSGTGS